MQSLLAEVEALVAETSIPSVSLCVRFEGSEIFHHTAGMARLEPPRPAVADQAYDLASLTKALAGSAVAASVVEQGLFALDGAVCRVLPEVDPRITLRHLLQHTSGLPWWHPWHDRVTGQWGTARARGELLAAVQTAPLQSDPGTAHTYSDTGFLVLLDLLERLTDTPFADLFEHRVRRPSGVEDLRWGWPMAAATEQRDVLVEGTVHDENCAALGGVSTHAGLFGTARAVAALAEAFLEAVRTPKARPGLPGRTLRRFWTEGSTLGDHVCGWDTPSEGYCSAGSHFPPDSVGHLGYTGCSLWIAPSRRTVVALLTNRVHPSDDKVAIREARPRLHDAVARALGWA